MDDLQHSVLGFIGGGNMASSLIVGLIESGINKQNIIAADPNAEKRQRLETLGVKTYGSDSEIAAKADILILAIKPKDVQSAIVEIKKHFRSKSLLISIAAGILSTTIERWLGQPTAIVRCMPNTPALLRAGATALYANGRVDEEQRNVAESILRGVGVTLWVNHEHDMDAVTALSGSGPAYFFILMEALQEAGESLGLNASTSKLLTLQTALGAARMALESEISLHELTEKVASKGGTTEQAIAYLESAGIRNIIKEAVIKAKNRAVEISQHFDQI